MPSTTPIKTPPQQPPKVLTTKSEILSKTNTLITQWRLSQSQILHTIHPDAATVINTIIPLAMIENSINTHTPILTLYEMTSTHLEVGEGSSEARKMIEAFKVERGNDRGLFELVNAVRMRVGVEGEYDGLEGEEKRLVEMMCRDFVGKGLNVAGDGERQRFKVIRKEIKHLTAEFQKNRTASAGNIYFTPAQLDGAPENVLSLLIPGTRSNSDKLTINLDSSEHCSISSFLKDSETRKIFELATGNKCVQNVPLLKEVVVLRAEAARLLGYENHAQMRLESRMAKTPEQVLRFLEDLRMRLVDAGKEEIDRLKVLKKRDFEERGGGFDNRFYPWDYAFYNRQLAKEKFSVDTQKVQEYFEVRTTVLKMLKNFEELFGLRFNIIGNKDAVWDENVEVYSSWDEAWDEEELGGGFLGYLYLDLFDREGKDSGIFNCTLQPGYLKEDGTRHYPSTVLFCSFSKPTSNKPCLLSQFNLVMLFHELGHGIHGLVSKTRYSRFHGTEVAVDFGEAPSQMLENWCWKPSFLRSLGQHYSYTTPEHLNMFKEASKDAQPPEHIPDDMITGIVGSKYCGKPNFLLGQVLFALFDMKIHMFRDADEARNLDLVKKYNEMVKEVQMFDIPSDRRDWVAPFVVSSHLMEEYDAGYYSYLFSQVYSTDMFYSAFKGDLGNKIEGRRYRKFLLEKGGSQDEMTTLKEFLGREPSIESFYKDLALD